MTLHMRATGKVQLVGAGPGDPDLLTLKALKAIQAADLILFDQLVGEGIKALFPQATPAFYVGKRKGRHSIAQRDLNQLLIKKARDGYNIVRLKGGDPFMFGRGGEEMLALVKAGVAVEVIPGISSAFGCAASASIPLTHRGLAQACTFITGHAESTLNVDWSALARLQHTLVFYMGLTNAALIQQQLMAHGLAAATPVAVIENGSRDNQREFTGCVRELASLVAAHRIVSPALIIVGHVVNVRDTVLAALAAQAPFEFAAPICA